MARVLVVDDDAGIVSVVKRGLDYEGFTVDTAGDGLEALDKVRDAEPDVVILDVMMPGIDGNEVARRLRRSSKVPILMLTARGTTADKVTGLESGADDYLVKPFEFEELVARVRALLRRGQTLAKEPLRFADLTLDPVSMEVRRGSTQVELTALEFRLLEFFMRHPNQVMGRDQIYQAVWGFDFEGESNVIEVYVRYLRSKLEAEGRPRLLHTVRGAGYTLRE